MTDAAPELVAKLPLFVAQQHADDVTSALLADLPENSHVYDAFEREFAEALALEKLVAVVFHEESLALAHGRDPQIVVEAPRSPGNRCGLVGQHHASVGCEANQPAVKQAINVRRQEEAVVRVEPLVVIGYAPGLDVACSKQPRARDAGDSASEMTTLEDVCSKLAVAQSGKYELALGRFGKWRTANFFFSLVFGTSFNRVNQQRPSTRICAFDQLKQLGSELFGDRSQVAALVAVAVLGANRGVRGGQKRANLRDGLARGEPGFEGRPCDRDVSPLNVPVLSSRRFKLRPPAWLRSGSRQANRADVLMGVGENHVALRHELQVVPSDFSTVVACQQRSPDKASRRLSLESLVVVHPPVPHCLLLQKLWRRVCPPAAFVVAVPSARSFAQGMADT